MALSLWNPVNDPFFGQFDRMFDRAFDRYFGAGGGRGMDLVPAAPVGGDLWTSLAGTGHAMDIVETDKGYEVVADAPGMNPEDINVEVQNGVITISGKHSQKREEKDKKGRVHRSERVMRSFQRSFGLPQNATDEGIEACLDKGVLRVTVPKVPEPEQPKPRRVTVKPGASAQRIEGAGGAGAGTTTM